ncbi:hypothetical protein HL658_33230 [Azospirillum sp. RWY-5-1]|uniref:Uncharacterized protein n=1 Tax=Azospirillum oleiclasticum TaxID=2735135 RepID=A0ABX2TKD1_9PROT|nr:hypothetical protein [Azospirillum oleiclasticum]NYZ17432.1 hypothetical protein [Azospirillum oleiclasticum]NYZ24809.1 hypothetical protein [Azospirillum oleiclasticum]
MSKYAESIGAAIATFLVSLVLPFFVGLSKDQNGYVNIGRGFEVNGSFYAPLDIDVVSSSPLNGLILSISKDVLVAESAVSHPVLIKTVDGVKSSDGSKLIEIGHIPPGIRLRILFKLENRTTANSVDVVNWKEKGIEYVYNGNSSGNTSLLSATTIISSTIYALISFSLFLGIASRSDKMKQSADEARKYMEGMQEKIESMKKEISQIKISSHAELKKAEESSKKTEIRFAKFKVLLLSRISDYSKELSFWRDCVRKMLNDRGLSEKNSEEIFNIVRNVLKTHRTNPRYDEDFKTIEVAAGIINSHEPQTYNSSYRGLDGERSGN